jgi:pyruvate dehydrogenase E1 component
LSDTWVLDTAFPAQRARPMVTLIDGHPHSLAFLATIHGVPSTQLGVSDFGVSGDLDSVYHHHGIDAGAVVGAALDLID